MGKSLIKKCFKSRFEGGKIVEMDFAQLEIVGLAILSNDLMLKTDLRDKLDLHCVNTANLYGVDYQHVYDQYKAGEFVWTDRRKTTKQLSFQLQYGAGVRSMSESTGVSKKVAQNFIDVYYDRYSHVKAWQEEVKREVESNAVPTANKTKLGYPSKRSWYKLPTGRAFVFNEYDAPEFMKDKGQHTSFSPTEMKNYPVQGFSTGDFMAKAMQLLGRHLIENDSYDGRILPICTVHDSFVFDVHPSVTHKELHVLKAVLRSTPKVMDRDYPKVNFDLDVDVDIEIGADWHSMKTL